MGNKILTNKDKKRNLFEVEKKILQSFNSVYNKIKRSDFEPILENSKLIIKENSDRYNNKLPIIKRELLNIKSKLNPNRHPHLFDDDGLLNLSAEDGEYFADYNGDIDGSGFPYIDPRVEEIAERFGLYWDWVNPGAIVLVPDY